MVNYNTSPIEALIGNPAGGAAARMPGLAPLTKEPVSHIVAPAPISVAALAIKNTAPAAAPAPPNRIPAPDYNDQGSRNNYLKQWASKYGDLQGRGDTIMKVNEIPRGGSDTMKNIAIKAASKYGIDPALLHSSAMEEGASGLFKDKSGMDTKHRKPGDFGYQDYFGDKEFPINGGQSFGLSTFNQRFPDLVKGGYLPKEFASRFRGKDGEFGANDFKTAEDGMQAKAAMLKYHYDDIDAYAKSKGITLTPKARDFFALAGYNGGEGAGHQMLSDYNKSGALAGDKFLEKRPTTGAGLKESSYGPVSPENEGLYNHVARRLKMSANLKKEGLFQ